MAILDILKRQKKEKGSFKKDEVKKKESPAKITKKKEVSSPVSLRVDAGAEGGERLASIILRPRITEKASFITEDGAYTFDVLPYANKFEVRKAIEEIYGVKPVRVNIVTIPGKQVRVRNRLGTKAGGKKAVVYLKKGDRIEFV